MQAYQRDAWETMIVDIKFFSLTLIAQIEI